MVTLYFMAQSDISPTTHAVTTTDLSLLPPFGISVRRAMEGWGEGRKEQEKNRI